MEQPLKALGQRLACVQDAAREASFDIERARARLLECVRPGKGRRARRGWTAVFAMALAAAVWVLVLRRGPLEFQVGSTGPTAQAGEWIAAHDRRVPITFSDGTELTLLENARARIVEVHANGASVTVERGSLRASIVRRPQAGWRVFVGPFEVKVTGTEFDVGWQPEREHFSLTLREGAVVVTGPGLGQALEMHAGEELHLSLRSGEQRLVRAASSEATPPPAVVPTQPPSATSAPEVEPETERSPGAAPASAPAAPGRRSDRVRARSPAAPDFRELAAASQYREALTAAERAGFERLCRTASANDVLLLADVARLAADFERARLAYASVRQRFGGAPGAHAAFFLGRIAFDHDADYAEAARLFALSTAEQPDGPLAREAAGRLLEAKLRLADSAGARQAARRYLERYPEGPHARSAERVLRVP